MKTHRTEVFSCIEYIELDFNKHISIYLCIEFQLKCKVKFGNEEYTFLLEHFYQRKPPQRANIKINAKVIPGGPKTWPQNKAANDCISAKKDPAITFPIADCTKAAIDPEKMPTGANPVMSSRAPTNAIGKIITCSIFRFL